MASRRNLRVNRDVVNRLPTPYGDPAALDTAASAAAPLLAGFAFVLIGLILDDRFQLAAKNLALFVLVLALLLLITAVESAFTARRYYVPPDELVALYELDAAAPAAAADAVSPTYLFMLSRHETSARVGRYAYNAGIICLLGGVAVTLIPRGGLHAPLRIAAVAAVGLAAVAELLWDVTPDEVRWTIEAELIVNTGKVKQRNPAKVAVLTVVSGLIYGAVWNYRVNREIGRADLAVPRCRQDDTLAALSLLVFYYICIFVTIEVLIGNWQLNAFAWVAAGVVAATAAVLFLATTLRRLLGPYRRLGVAGRAKRDGRISRLLDIALFLVPPLWYSNIQLKLNRTWSASTRT